jgi:DnaJ-class molecular chaperone
MAKDSYLVLQVTRGATPDEIHSAYGRRALELFPDRSGAGSEPFIELQEAYSVLSDPEQRAAYDRGAESTPIRRSESLTSRPSTAERFSEVEPASGFGRVSLSQSFETFAPSFDEIFDRLWSNFHLLTRPKAERLESLTMDVPLSNEQATTGGSVRILVPARARCQSCHGHGSIGRYECWRCQGHGFVRAEYPVDVPYPAGLRGDCVVRVPLDDFGIHNFFLTIRFRLTS